MLRSQRLDFVDIATRPESHLPLVRLAAEHGVPVICQKPMAPSRAEAAAMVEAAEAGGIRLMIHENWRWQEWYREIGRRLQAGDIGAPVSYSFRTRRGDGFGPDPYQSQPYFRQMPRLLIFETLVHHIDTARFLFGGLTRLYAQARRVNPSIAGEDCALLALTHESGIAGIVDGHRFTELDPDGPAMEETLIEGESGSLTLLSDGNLYAGSGVGRKRIWTHTAVEGYRGDSVARTGRHFAECLRTGARFESEGRDYLENTYDAVEAAYESVAQGRAVDLRRR
jgi:predicted dehydrogenase